MKGLVISCAPTPLLFGPPPKTRDELKWLIQEKRVTLILNTCPALNQRTRTGVDKAEFYMEFLKPREKEEEEDELFVNMKRVPFNLFEFETKGRTKDAQEESLARFYVSHARLLLKEIQKEQKAHTVYVHNQSGIMEEAYLTLALWRLLASKDVPHDLLQWIKEHDYEWLFDDDNDKKHMLELIMQEVEHGEKKLNFFKKIKK